MTTYGTEKQATFEQMTVDSIWDVHLLEITPDWRDECRFRAYVLSQPGARVGSEYTHL